MTTNVAHDFHLKLPAVAESVPRARHAVSDYASEHGVELEPLERAVTEAVANVVRHAYPESAPGEIAISVAREGTELVVRVADTGVGLSPTVTKPDLSLGLPLMISMSERVEIDTSGPGRVVTMAFAAAH